MSIKAEWRLENRFARNRVDTADQLRFDYTAERHESITARRCSAVPSIGITQPWTRRLFREGSLAGGARGGANKAARRHL